MGLWVLQITMYVIHTLYTAYAGCLVVVDGICGVDGSVVVVVVVGVEIEMVVVNVVARSGINGRTALVS